MPPCALAGVAGSGANTSAARDFTISGTWPSGPVRVIFQDDTYDSTDHGTKVSEASGADPRTTWHWDNVRNSDQGNQLVTFNLTAGNHTLEFAYREDGARLDRILVTNDPTFVPTGTSP